MVNYKCRIFTAIVAILAPCVAVAQDWNGIYGGLTLGYTLHEADHSFSNGAPSGSSDPNGALYGGFAGYGFQTGKMVIGAEVNFEGSTAKNSYTTSFSSGQAELNAQGAIRGILGYAGKLGPFPALFYGAVGWAYGDFNFRGGPGAGGPVDARAAQSSPVQIRPGRGGALSGGYSDKLNGITLGLGVDTRLGNNLSLRAEYSYTNYGKSSGSLAPNFPTVQMPVSVKQHSFRIGIRKDF